MTVYGFASLPRAPPYLDRYPPPPGSCMAGSVDSGQFSISIWVTIGKRQGGQAVQGKPIPGGFNPITGIDGIRYAVRLQSVGIIHDADNCRDETMIQLHGGHIVRVPCSLDDVLGWST